MPAENGKAAMLLPTISAPLVSSTGPLERFGRNIVVPVSAFIIGTIIIVLAFVLFTAVRQNSIAIDASTRLAKTALAVKEREIGRNLKDYAIWEAAYQNLHVKFDFSWASTDGNVGANILNSLGYDMAFVVASDDRTVYSVIDGNPTSADVASVFRGKLAPMLNQARTKSDPLVGLFRANGQVALVALNAILPPTEVGPPPQPADRSVLIFVKVLNTTFLDRIRTEYLLRALKLSEPGQISQGASLPLRSPSGEDLGSIAWEPDRPGTELLRFLLPPIIVALIGLATFAWLVLKNARRSAVSIEHSARTIQAYAQILENSEARFRDVAEASSDWIWETDTDLRLTYLSDRFTAVTGIAAATILGRPLDQFFLRDSDGEGWANLIGDTWIRNTFRDLRCCYRDAKDNKRICRIAGRPIFHKDESFLGYRGTATDVTREVEAHALAQHLAHHDPLTGLPNRVLLKDRLNVALLGVERGTDMIAIHCLDLDYFKEVNDTLGHGVGDILLQQVAQRLRACVRATDTVARLGGDEFAILQTGLSTPQDADAICCHVLESLKAPFRLGEHELYIAASIGVSLAPQDGLDHEHLMRNADIALYRAKHAGRSTFRMFEARMDAELQSRKSLEQDLRQAISKEELELHYQPIVQLQGQQLCGAEALLRWRHPQHGLILPERFIPVAEATGLVHSIGEWALRAACEQAKEWPDLQVAINLSPIQFKQRELVETVRNILRETHLEPARLELEITENVLLYDTKVALEMLTALKRLGVSIALDDFGTGYSSLAYLNGFPFDTIKIDKSFIADIHRTGKSNAIVKSVISLGRSLGMTITAEGVETAEQSKFLADEGCRQVQGYFFGKPMPGDQFNITRNHWNASSVSAPAA
jgi:diguanylate cyclase (GGDEF)-like protein/PAS domain S-box-containing protein